MLKMMFVFVCSDVRSCVSSVWCRRRSTELRLLSTPNWNHRENKYRDVSTRTWMWVTSTSYKVIQKLCIQTCSCGDEQWFWSLLVVLVFSVMKWDFMLQSLYACGCFYITKAYHGLSCPRGASQTKKKHYDVELENLEKLQKQTIERMETDHNIKLKDETKRIKSEQERDHHRFQDQLKQKKKEVCCGSETVYSPCVLCQDDLMELMCVIF